MLRPRESESNSGIAFDFDPSHVCSDMCGLRLSALERASDLECTPAKKTLIALDNELKPLYATAVLGEASTGAQKVRPGKNCHDICRQVAAWTGMGLYHAAKCSDKKLCKRRSGCC